MEMDTFIQAVFLLTGAWILLSLLLDDDDPSDGGPRRKRKLAPIRVRTRRSLPERALTELWDLK